MSNELKEKEGKDSFIDNFVEADYKGRKFRFYALSLGLTIKYAQELLTNPTKLLEDDEKMLEIIRASLGKKVQIRKTPGFYVFALTKILEAIDIDFLLESSGKLQKMFREIAEKMGLKPEDTIPPESLPDYQKKQGSLPTTS